MIMVHHLGQSNQDSENLSKAKTAWGKSPPKSLRAFQQRILPDQIPYGGMTKYF